MLCTALLFCLISCLILLPTCVPEPPQASAVLRWTRGLPDSPPVTWLAGGDIYIKKSEHLVTEGAAGREDYILSVISKSYSKPLVIVTVRLNLM